jgi:DNA (cytosine-5)-methyltransferase 1
VKNQFSVVSLFSGGMGLDTGLGKVGRFKLMACVEKIRPFCDTIRLNQQEGRLPEDLIVEEADIKSVDAKELRLRLGLKKGELDVLVGGPPCQTFSTAGRRASLQDARGTLIWDYLRFVEEFEPKVFLMENVRGILSASISHRKIKDRPENGGSPLMPEEEPGCVVRLFCEDLEKATKGIYHMDCYEVNSVNYGAPQIRERALFIGNRLGVMIDFPNPTHGPKQSSGEGEKKKQTEFEFSTADKLPPWATLRDAIGNLSEKDPEVMDFSPRKKKFLAKVPEGANWRSLPEDLQKESMGKAWLAKGGRSGWWRRLTFDLPSPTLVTMPNHASTALCHPKETRALSLREYARIQEFPDDWKFSGSTTQKYAQVGNAVPVRLAEIAGQLIADVLDAHKSKGLKKYEKANGSCRKIYIQSHIRTRSWFKDGEVKIWDETGDQAYSAPRTRKRTSNLKE